MGEFALPTVAVNYDKLQTAIQHAIEDEKEVLYPANDPRVGYHVRMGGLRAIMTLIVGYGTPQYHSAFRRVREQMEAGVPSGTIAIKLLDRFGIKPKREMVIPLGLADEDDILTLKLDVEGFGWKPVIR